MQIKYKGTTGALLADLSMELQRQVDIRTSETVLLHFFHRVLKELTMEKSIELLCLLPASLKPFCDLSYKEPIEEHELFSCQRISFTAGAVMKALDKYVKPENLVKIYSCLPESAFPDTVLLKNHWTREVLKA